MASKNKSEKFVELANKRVNKALKDLKLIGNLSNRRNYEFNDEQVKKIVKALQKEVDSIKQSFLEAESQDKDEFSL